MCGIFCVLYKNDSDLLEINDLVQQIEKNIKNRGPDNFKSQEVQCGDYHLQIKASVLWLQGEVLTSQPINNKNSFFAYNGDLFYNPRYVTEGDTKVFLQNLENSNDISATFKELLGPYAFIYLNKAKSKLYFGRDRFGRRSLLIGIKNDILIITSVAYKTTDVNFIELPASGTFVYDLKLERYELLPWPNKAAGMAPLKEFLGRELICNTVPVESIKKNVSDLIDFTQFTNWKLSDAMRFFTTDISWLQKLERLNTLLENSIRERISNQPKFCRDCLPSRTSCNHCTVGVLFSGGLDCTILASIVDKFIDKNLPIDLLNVAFDTKNNNFQTPDRLTAESSFEELKALRPYRKWNLLKINVGNVELRELCDLHVKHLVFPLTTILDESLGCALWFASRGKVDDYISPCRVVLVGMGADELFGGYTKHRAAFKHKSWSGLIDSMELDWQNISHRNLGRDDRVVADHGRQLRTPYLDEKFVEYVRSLDVWERTYPSDDFLEGNGDKYLLRSLAFYLGLTKAATFKKRALQFGSRIANNKENANDVSPRL